MAKFGRAGHAVSWAAGSRRIRFGRESRALVFRSRKSGNGNSCSRESGHIKHESRYFGRATSASVTIVATDHRGRISLEIPSFGRQSVHMPNFGLESLYMPKFCYESLEMSLGPRPGQEPKPIRFQQQVSNPIVWKWRQISSPRKSDKFCSIHLNSFITHMPDNFAAVYH